MEKKMKVMIMLFALFVLVLSFLFYYRANHSMTGEVIFPISEDSPASIHTISIEPEIKVLKMATALVGVKNTDKEKKEYKLYIYAVKEGVVKESSDFSFSLKPGRKTTVSLDFLPDSIGEYEILAKLYDKDEIKLFDTRTLKTTSVSDIGPFDLSLDVITKKVEPGNSLPIVLRMLNTGKKGSEVKIKVKMYCTNKTTKEEFFIFLKSDVETAKSISLLTCDETGLKTVTAELELLGTSLITSSSQVFLGKPYSMKIKVPSTIEVKQGQSVVLSITVENIENKTLNDLQLNVENIPLKWVSEEPSSIATFKPGETAIFILNLSIPQDTDAGEYPIKINVGSDNAFASERATLNIIGIEEKEREKKPIELSKLKIVFFIVGIIVIIFFIIKIFIARRAFGEIHKKRDIVLRAIKS